MCGTYLFEPTPDAEANEYLTQLNTILSERGYLSAVAYTQITDVELECDGLLNYDRSAKFDAATTNMLYVANQELIGLRSGPARK